jgi:hypothetical protein
MQGKTKSGFAYEIDDRILTDWRFTEAIAKCQHSEGMKQLEGAHEMVRLMFGADGFEKFMNHIASQNDGFIPAEVVMAEVQDIFESKIPKN